MGECETDVDFKGKWIQDRDEFNSLHRAAGGACSVPSASQESNSAQLQREVAIIAPVDPESDESAERMEVPKGNSDAQKIYYTDEDQKFNSISERPGSMLITLPSTCLLYTSRCV